MNAVSHNREKYINLFLIGLFAWSVVNGVFIARKMDWLQEEPDTKWYWSVVENLLNYDPAVQPGYPAIVALVHKVVPNVPGDLVMQAVALLSYLAALPVMYLIFVSLGSSLPFQGTLLWALFPFVGVTNVVYPRVNATLLLVEVIAIWGVINNKKWALVLSLATLPLLHRSSLILMAVLVPLALWEKKLKLWMIPVIILPGSLYWWGGALYHNNLLWYLTGYKSYENVLGLPVLDGLLGTIVRGGRGEASELIQGSFMLFYFFASCILVVFFIRERRFLLAGLAVPPIVLGVYLPANEIWSMVNYTTYTAIPLLLFGETKNSDWMRRGYFWNLLLLACFLSQVGYAVYVAFIFYPPN